MLARGALCRLAAEVPKQATHDLPKLATLVHTARTGYALPLRTLSHVSQIQIRSYVTTKAAKEPTETVKKAVKAKAAAGKSVKKTTTTKKAAPKKAKKEAAPKKPVKKAKKVLTDEEKEKKVISRLRELALREPVSRNSLSAFNVYLAESLKGLKKQARDELGENATAWKNITPTEHEKWNHLAAERNEARAAEYKAWVESHTPDQIRIANNARNLLRRKLAGKLKGNAKPGHTQLIVDERQVKRAQTAWSFFFAERQASSDFKSIAIAERAKLIAGEWKALSADEKRRFEDQAAAEKQRYLREQAAQAKA
ncbi:hypothetical protein BU25DRAFT_406687 [Macroventuria anomochaeta]|uniref:Uncharacterized protein n=1 Tax=Macroventuria anomochaeta TaxID=301207 RepID=A0ACB6SDV6_9PLEO|nr:uncharacterized protein BU25DRAFT_406687 [Macroventuria anomochaeta]KAF2632162.1 hypothetical protein BU25DRAFT_406687 [Macroventuria anomochaeta]